MQKTIFSIEDEAQTELRALAELKDEDIDFSDIPETNFDELGKPIIGKFYQK